ncbi:hypothetical protein Trydic_g2868 [Trypoxylus dichotomus]
MTEDHRRKFQTISPKPRPGPKPKVVVNLSSRPLSDNEELVLAKGLNYAIKKIRFETAKYLISAKPSNLAHEETKALKNLQSDPDSIILPVDKGKCHGRTRQDTIYVKNNGTNIYDRWHLYSFKMNTSA